MTNIFSAEKRRKRSKIRISSCNKSLRPRIIIFRSNKNTYLQLLNDNGDVLVAYSSLMIEGGSKNKTGIEIASLVGSGFSKSCIKKGFIEVVFDKGSYFYGGRVKVAAEACKKNGLKF
ncbi:50S ribosomal protein L18 [Flavobacteriaceae bacterium]|nr:50S ribosomal protein L18 [Flavobacteriaceae bacterium]